jgi:hypothetical protein
VRLIDLAAAAATLVDLPQIALGGRDVGLYGFRDLASRARDVDILEATEIVVDAGFDHGAPW